ncbi:hypothetical protein AVEN_205691-1 [Araneus ventricosus]|uniref:Secreted protein n=1 Tax=Araneus ventricosus TaxID=182803 RepID=A0A4Y2KL08_ARAVE|nr:hypothetical protein AVEN_35970-1 [Araneus ventricosus]GBN02958.1 hypothetical protein AVEN_106017-1 [Araneus ventricosus]GBN03013.1 hypothetical protein AVEN_170202-1 [Araneus ventricosus]GBN03045.1 hypothetical protein AVEN_205691-1 [Araneus ventricosus]
MFSVRLFLLRLRRAIMTSGVVTIHDNACHHSVAVTHQLLAQFNSIDTGSSQPSLQAKDGGRPNITVLKYPSPFVKCDSFHTDSARFLL